MRILILAVLFTLTSCATNAGTPELESRLASWNGSSIFGLAKELGEPTSISDAWWEWRFTGPGMPETASASSLARPTAVRCSGCDPNPPATTGYVPASGLATATDTPTGTTGIRRKECVYRALIDETTIVQIETFAISGRCQFDQVPFLNRNRSTAIGEDDS